MGALPVTVYFALVSSSQCPTTLSMTTGDQASSCEPLGKPHPAVKCGGTRSREDFLESRVQTVARTPGTPRCKECHALFWVLSRGSWFLAGILVLGSRTVLSLLRAWPHEVIANLSLGSLYRQVWMRHGVPYC